MRLSGSIGKACPFCPRRNLEGDKGIASHIARSPECKVAKRHKILEKLARLKASSQNTNAEPDGPSAFDIESSERTIETVDNGLLQDGNIESHSPPIGERNGPLNPGGGQQRFHIRSHPDAAYVYGSGLTPWEEIKKKEDPKKPFDPWISQEEYELVEWLSTEKLSQGAINRFLNLAYTQARPPSFLSAKAMYERISRFMPQGPSWDSTLITLPDAPTEPQVLFYRNPIECAAFLFSNPSFAKCMMYAPVEMYEDDKVTRLYSEMHTGNVWNEEQLKAPKGSTIMPIILASDKTHLTDFSGDKSMHAVYLSIGNISKDVRNKPSRRAWLLLAKVPTPKFSKTSFSTAAERKSMPGILKRQLFHRCMRLVLAPLRVESPSHGLRMATGADGKVRMCIAILMAWIGDLEELWIILGLAKNSCPKCLARYKDLDNSHSCEPRTGLWITNRLAEIRAAYPSADTWQFVSKAKEFGLCGVEDVCWEGLSVDICRVVSIDVLHGMHKMFKDHMMSWLTHTVGEADLDLRFMAQPHRIGARNFSGGISHISQSSGRENRDLERHISVVVAGHENARVPVLKSLRGLLDFIFKAQFPLHSDSTLAVMEKDLQLFHANKKIFIENGSREGTGTTTAHLKIPKIHNLCHTLPNVRDNGTTDNYCTEIDEILHISMCKIPYKATNRKEYAVQIINNLRRQESLSLYTSYLRWRLNKYPNDGDAELIDDLLADVENLPIPDEPDVCLSSITHAKKPHRSRMSIDLIIERFQLPDLSSSIIRYFDFKDNGSSARRVNRAYYERSQLPSAFDFLDLWYMFRLTPELPNEFYPSQVTTIHCKPAHDGRHAVFDPVLVEVNELASGLKRYRVAELRLIFRPSPTRNEQAMDLHAYVLWYSPPSAPLPNIKLRTVKKEIGSQGRIGGIVKLESIKFACPLSPVLEGDEWNRNITPETCLELVDQFYLNCFAGHVEYELLA